jgi:ferredoxin
MQPLDEDELAAIFRRIEKAARVRPRQLDAQQRRTSFTEVDPGLSPAEALREARRCLSCGCGKAGDCRVRRLATDYGADPRRFAGERRRFRQDLSHPDIVYEPGKCIVCDACVRVAAAAGEKLGVAIVGRGFKVTMATPFDEPLSAALQKAAEACAAACPTGALTLRRGRACELCGRVQITDLIAPTPP